MPVGREDDAMVVTLIGVGVVGLLGLGSVAALIVYLIHVPRDLGPRL